MSSKSGKIFTSPKLSQPYKDNIKTFPCQYLFSLFFIFFHFFSKTAFLSEFERFLNEFFFRIWADFPYSTLAGGKFAYMEGTPPLRGVP
jgi:hypothetical protein